MANNASNRKTKQYVCETPQASDLTQTEFEALTWVEIGGALGTLGTMVDEAFTAQPTLDDDITQPSKGSASGAEAEFRTNEKHGDPGQDALLIIGETNQYYPFKIVRNDAPNSAGTGTTIYTRALFGTGKGYAAGEIEDYPVRNWKTQIVQIPITVPAVAG